jgi:predicted secreted protein
MEITEMVPVIQIAIYFLFWFILYARLLEVQLELQKLQGDLRNQNVDMANEIYRLKRLK